MGTVAKTTGSSHQNPSAKGRAGRPRDLNPSLQLRPKPTAVSIPSGFPHPEATTLTLKEGFGESNDNLHSAGHTKDTRQITGSKKTTGKEQSAKFRGCTTVPCSPLLPTSFYCQLNSHLFDSLLWPPKHGQVSPACASVVSSTPSSQPHDL